MTLIELRATYRLQLGGRLRLRARPRARALPARARRQSPLPARRSCRPRRARPTATTSSTRRACPPSSAASRRLRELAAAARAPASCSGRRPQPHGDAPTRTRCWRDERCAGASSTSIPRPAGTAASSTSTISPACARGPRGLRGDPPDGPRARRATGCRRPAHRPSRRPRRSGRLPASGCARAASSASGSRRSSARRGEPLRDWPVVGTVGYEFAERRRPRCSSTRPASGTLTELYAALHRRSPSASARSRARPSSSRRGRRSRPSSSASSAGAALLGGRRRRAWRRCRSTAPTSSRGAGRVDDADRDACSAALPTRSSRRRAAARRERGHDEFVVRFQQTSPGDHGQGRRGHRVLPLPAPARAQRGRRRPGALRNLGGRRSTPRTSSGRARFCAGLLAVADARHQALAATSRARIGALAGMADEWRRAVPAAGGDAGTRRPRR